MNKNQIFRSFLVVCLFAAAACDRSSNGKNNSVLTLQEDASAVSVSPVPPVKPKAEGPYAERPEDLKKGQYQVFSVPGGSKSMVEVTCDGMTYLVKQTSDPKVFEDKYIELNEISGLEIRVSGHEDEATLRVKLWADEQPSLNAETYSGNDVKVKSGNMEFNCYLNNGDQISDL